MTHLPPVPPSPERCSDIRQFRDFPILAETRTRMRKQMQSSQVNFDALSKIVERDPALCLHLMINTVEQNPDCLSQITGAASCVSLLGMKELVSLIKQLPVVETDCDERPLQLYRRALLIADMAGEFAAHWASQKGTSSVSSARWGTLLVSAPLWQWLVNEELAQNWFYCLSQGQDLAASAHQTFGDEQLSQWQQQAKQLHLPAMAVDCYRSETQLSAPQWRLLRHHDPRDLDNQRSLLHQVQQPCLTAWIATALAWHWHISPTSKLSQRWLSIAAHWSGKPAAMLLPGLRILQVNASHYHNDGMATGLSLLLSPDSRPGKNQLSYPLIQSSNTPQPESETSRPDTASDTQTSSRLMAEAAALRPTIDTTPATPGNATLGSPSGAQSNDHKRELDQNQDENRQPDHLYLNKLVQQLQQEPDSFGDWHYLMRGVLKGVCRGIGLSGACITLLNKDKTLMKVFYTEGNAKLDPIRKLAVDLRKPSVFNKLLEKTASLQIAPANRDKFLRGLPASTLDIMPSQLVIMSIDAGHAPVGLVIAYNEHGEQSLSADEYRAFKNLCQTASRSLAMLRSNTADKRQ